ncbi:MAG: FAD-binding protein [Coriobacteriales bacterium]
MLEVRNVRVGLAHAGAQGAPCDPAYLAGVVARELGLTARDIEGCSVARRAVDARRKTDVHFVVTAHARLRGGEAAERRLVGSLASDSVRMWEPPAFDQPLLGREVADERERPVVIGAGCAGLFCALVLARAGARPVLVERGDDPRTRTRAIRGFERTGELDPESNVQFGCGGAGMFSDGKLTTGTKSPAIPWVLREMAAAGAPDDILWEARPHVGSDYLPRVVEGILAQLERLGADVLLRTRADELVVEGGRVTGVRVSPTLPAGQGAGPGPKTIACESVVLACGHSARDTYRSLLDAGVEMRRKPFAMGARVEHLQASIDRAQYGSVAGNPALPPADYKLSCHLGDGRGVFTFCMCPGGHVVAAASEPGGVVTNGMSEFARDARNANSALLVGIDPADLPGDDVLAGVELQRRCERRAFELGGGSFAAPAQRVGDFLAGRPSTRPGEVEPSYPRGVRWGAVDGALPDFVAQAMRAGLRQMGRRLRGFDAADAVLTAPESRSSAPVRVVRDEGRQSVSTRGLFPCGEGGGYAGGIMSAATDGVATARAVIERMSARS